jgi:cell division septation protein DedD
VADVTHDLADDGFHEIHLSGKHLVFLFMMTTALAVLVFLCGVWVGRGVPTARTPDAMIDPTAANAPAPSAPAADAGPPAAEPPAPAPETDELSYKKRLESEATPRETLKPAPERPAAIERPTPAPQTKPQPAAPAAAAATGTAPQSGTWVLQVHALRDAKVANGIVQRLTKKGYPAFVVPSGAPAGMYRVFVGRYKDRGEAERVADRLKKEEQFNPWITR